MSYPEHAPHESETALPSPTPNAHAAGTRAPVKISDVARAAGVSPGTVSNAINQPGRVNSRTLKRVKSAIAELGYVPNRTARQLRVGMSATIGLIVPDLSYPFFTDLARAAEAEAERLGIALILANSDVDPAREKRLLGTFAQQRLQGVLIAPIGTLPEEAFALKAQGTALVLLDNEGGARDAFSSVSSDSVHGGRLATRHLIERGARSIAFVGTPTHAAQVQHRLEGAREESQLTPGVTITMLDPQGRGLSAGYALGTRLAGEAPENRPDAILAPNDALAVGLVNALVHHGGLELLRSVKVVGYDDLEIAATAAAPLTTVRQPSDAIARSGVELLHNLGTNADSELRHIVYPPSLIVRETT